MQRIIKIEIRGNRARVSSSALGTPGEAAATDVLLTFDESWDGLSKKLIWRAPDSAETAYTLLGTPDGDGVYTAAVPVLPLSRGGEALLTVEGCETTGTELTKRARSVELRFFVEPNDMTSDEPYGGLCVLWCAALLYLSTGDTARYANTMAAFEQLLKAYALLRAEKTALPDGRFRNVRL